MKWLTDRNQDGFTLIELIIVVVVIAVLAAIAIPVYSGFQNQAKQTAVDTSARNLNTSLAYYNTDVSTTRDYNDGLLAHLRDTVDTSRDNDIAYQIVQPEGTNSNEARRCVEVFWRGDRDISALAGQNCDGNGVSIQSCEISGDTMTVEYTTTGNIDNIRVSYGFAGRRHTATIPASAGVYSFSNPYMTSGEITLRPRQASGTSAGANATANCS